MKVRDMMTKNVVSVRRDEPLSVAAQIMWDCDCGAVPVKDDSSDRVVGMLTDRDICMATWSQNRAPAAIRVSEAMSPEIYYTTPEDSVSSAEDLMRSKQIRRVPVLDESQKLIGILSLADIATESHRKGTRPGTGEFAPAEVATTLAGICQPRIQEQPTT